MWKKKCGDNPVYYPLDLSKIGTWSTFERCVTLTFFNQQATGKFAFADNLVCDVKIYDGDNFNGERKDLRFTATLSLPDSFIHEIEKNYKYQVISHNFGFFNSMLADRLLTLNLYNNV